jgi:ABC-2 type transport system permease protein
VWRILAARELAEHWRDRRFVFSLGVCVAVAVAFAVLELPEWSRRQQAAGQDEVRRKEYVRDALADGFGTWGVQFLPLPAARTPSRLSPFAAGVEAAMDEIFTVTGFGLSTSKPDLKRRLFGYYGETVRLDVVLLVGTLFGLFALVFGSMGVTAERETGTLPLVLAQGASRRSVFFSKYLGLLAHSAVLLAALFLLLGLGALTGGLRFSAGEILTLGVLLAVSVLYLSSCVLLGLCISVVARTTQAAVTWALIAWVGLVLVGPTAAMSAGAALAEPPRSWVYRAEWRTKADEIDAGVRRKMGMLLPSLPPGTARRTNAAHEGTNVNTVPPAAQVIVDAAVEEGDMASALFAAMERTRLKQNQTAALWGRPFPVASYSSLAASLTGTGAAHQERLAESVAGYAREWRDYLREVRALPRPAGASYEEIAVNPDRLPHFRRPQPDVASACLLAWPDLLVLVLWNAALAIAGVQAFCRRDVIG